MKKTKRELIEQALTNMGYRSMNTVIWGKPIAHSIFTVIVINDEVIWRNSFKNNDKLYVWESKKISIEDFSIDFIKDCEMHTYVNHGNSSEFEFGDII